MDYLSNNDCFYFNLSISFRTVSGVMERTLKRTGLTPMQFLALKSLYERDGMTIKELSELLMHDSTTITRLVDRLEKAQLVVRKSDDSDRRVINLFLSESAKSYAPRAKKIWHRVNRVLKSNFNETDLIGFFNVMNRIKELSFQRERTLRETAEELNGRN
ncbi:MAG: MarR family transcriptional regulator [Leptospira sp.]|nr:MarR family transcriptional regulator [Leptospira sp.]